MINITSQNLPYLTSIPALFLDILLNIDDDDKLTNKIYSKSGDLSLPIVSFQYLCSNVPFTIYILSSN